MKILARPRRRILDVALDRTALDSAAQAKWQAFLEFVGHSLRLKLVVRDFSGVPPEDGTDFVYVSDSAALTRKLWLSASRVYIQPRSAPLTVDGFFYWKWLQHVGSLPAWQLRDCPVSLISSVFCGDEFLQGFLANSARFAGYANCEHFLVRAGSPGHEHESLVEHVRRWPAAVYFNFAEDPGLYEVWNLGARLATGRYLSNANIDDRRAPGHIDHLRGILDRDLAVDVASTALRLTKQRNMTWEDSDSCSSWFAGDGDFRVNVDGLFKPVPTGLASRNLPNCMPLWRRSLHARVGDFDEERYGPSADWAFWVRAGMQGSRFYLSAEPLGLYLRDDASYWHRDPARHQADDRIVAEYLAWRDRPAGHDVRHESPPLLQPHSHEIAAVIALLDSGAAYEGLGRLLDLARHAHQPGTTESELLSRVASRYFGCTDFSGLASRYRDSHGPGRMADLALFNACVDLVHGLDTNTDRVLRTLELICSDLGENFGDSRGQLLFALLSHRRGNAGVEQCVLREAHQADRAQFWSIVQRVYRFARPLPDLCAAVSDVAASFEPARRGVEHQLVFYPDYSGNAYLDLLYRPLRQSGGQVWGTSDEEAFLNVRPRAGSENILHIHWIKRLFDTHEHRGKTLEQRAGEFLEGVARQKRQGFRIFWTIHNSLSHESVDPQAELLFRQKLYRLADKVFLHHPLAAELLEWLPARDKLCLCEHGHYDLDVARGISRRDARAKLGLAEDDFVVAHLGHILDYKGLGEVLPVLSARLDKNPRMKLLVGGRIRSTETYAWLQAHPHRNLLVHDGYLSNDDLHCWMRAADFGVLSYNRVLTSGSLFHWLSCGRPVLSPASGTIPAYLVDGWNGYGYRDAESLQELLDHCAALPETERERLGSNAYLTAQQMAWRLWG